MAYIRSPSRYHLTHHAIHPNQTTSVSLLQEELDELATSCAPTHETQPPMPTVHLTVQSFTYSCSQRFLQSDPPKQQLSDSPRWLGWHFLSRRSWTSWPPAPPWPTTPPGSRGSRRPPQVGWTTIMHPDLDFVCTLHTNLCCICAIYMMYMCVSYHLYLIYHPVSHTILCVHVVDHNASYTSCARLHTAQGFVLCTHCVLVPHWPTILCFARIAILYFVCMWWAWGPARTPVPSG